MNENGKTLSIKELTKNAKFKNFLPKENVENSSVDTLMFYIQEANVNNIGVIGNYGSGKSTIIKSCINKMKSKTITVSLASFEAETGKNKEINHQIEYGILQQLFLRKKGVKVFELIKLSHVILISFLIVIIGGLLHLYGIDIFSSPYEQLKNVRFWIFDKYTPYIIIFLITMTVILLSDIFIGFIVDRVYLSKVSYKNFELVFKEGEKQTGSVISRNIRKIISLFSMRRVKIVIFEDIDRFNNEWIFVKLRELCGILNSSQAIKNVKFIYAIRDELFAEKIENRMKFFDAIVPIIPSMTTVNSYEVMKDLFDGLDKAIRPDYKIIEILCSYIYDRRLVINIFNEYLLYLKNLDNKGVLDFTKLHSFIVYKNMYPEDFTNLQQDSGVLYNTLARSHNYDNEITSKLTEGLNEFKQNIEKSKTDITNIQDLRKIYLYNFIAPYLPQGVIHFDNAPFQFETNLDDIIFDKLQKKPLKCLINNGRSWLELPNFQEYLIGTDYSYEFETLKKGKAKSLRLLNDELNRKNIEILEITTKDFSEKMKFDYVKNKISSFIFDEYQRIYIEPYNKTPQAIVLSKCKEKLHLLIFMLENGYLGQDYVNYITYFYEGKRSMNDVQFEKIVLRNNEPIHDLKLTGIEEIIKRLENIEYYSRESILNYDFFEYLSRFNLNINYFNRILESIKHNFERRSSFIIKYLYSEYNKVNVFIKINDYWDNFFDTYIESNVFSKEEMLAILNNLLECDKDLIIAIINNNIKLLEFITNSDDFSAYSDEKFMFLLSLSKDKIQLRFKNLDVNYYGSKELEQIIDNKQFEINSNNIKFLTNDDTRNVGLFSKSLQGNDKLKNIIIEQMIYAVNELIIKDKSSNEDCIGMKEIINSNIIELDTKNEVLNIQKESVLRHEDIESDENLQLCIDLDKVIIDWKLLLKVFADFHEKEKYLKLILNRDSSINQLQKDDSKKLLEEYKDLYLYIIKLELEKNKFEKIIQNINVKYSNIESIKKENIEILVANRKLAYSNKILDNLIRIEIKNIDSYVKQYIDQFIEEYKEFDYFFDEERVLHILNSNVYDISEKARLVEFAYSNAISLEYKQIKNMFKTIDPKDYSKFMENINMLDLKCALVASNLSRMTKGRILNELMKLGDPYDKLTKQRYNVEFTNNIFNKDLIDELDRIGIISKKEVSSVITVNTKTNKNIEKEHNKNGVLY